jgi:hypothetical protein
MAADPCLVPYGLEFVPTVIAACPTAERCLAYDCGVPWPPSRIAAPDPTSASGCRFANECASPADCIVASDLRGCCACPNTVFPKDLTLVNPCISPPGPPAGVVCNDCSGVVCAPCPSQTLQVICGPSGAYLTCGDVIPL